MRHTICDLFDAIHYCNKFVKTSYCTDANLKKDFYGKKRDLIYHMVKMHKSMQISISECRIDIQKSLVENHDIRLYAFCLGHEGSMLRVHQKSGSKLDNLFAMQNIIFETVDEYVYTPDSELDYTQENTDNAMAIINAFYKKWHLHRITNNLGDKKSTYQVIFDSYAYFYPDFEFSLETPAPSITKKSVIQVKHRKSGRVYKLHMKTLRNCGDTFLPLWRKSNKKCKNCW